MRHLSPPSSPGQTPPARALDRALTAARWRSPWLIYPLVVLLTLIILFARLALGFQPGDPPALIIFALPIILSAYLGGLRPGLLATVLATILSNYVLLPPYLGFSLATELTALQTGLLLVTGILISVLSEALHRARHQADASQQRLAVTLASIGDGVIATDLQGHVTFLNSEAERLTGWTLAEATGQPLPVVCRIVNAHTRMPAEDPAAKILQNGVAGGLANHTLLIGRDGTETPIDNSGAPIRDSASAILGVVLVFRDVSERERAESAHGRLAAIVESSTDAIISKDLQGTITTWNAGAERMFGYAASDMIGQPITRIIPPDRHHEEPMILARLRRGELVESLETVRQRQDGTLLDVSVTISPLRDSAGQITGASKILRDISDQKRAEAELRERERKLTTMLELLPVGISILDADRKIVYVNPALAAITDLSVQELLHDRHIARTYLNGSGEPMPAEAFASVRALREHRTIQNVETGVVKSDGSVIWINVSATPVDFPDWRLVAVTSDITERKQAEIELRRSTKRLHVLAEASRVFAQANTDDRVVLERVARTTAEEVGDLCSLRLLSDDGAWLTTVELYDASQTFSPEQLAVLAEPISVTMVKPFQAILQSGHSQLLPTLDREALRAAIKPEDWPTIEGIIDCQRVVAPLRVGGQPIGLLGIIRKMSGRPPFSADDLRLVEDLADRAALAISNAQLFTQLADERALLARRVEERTADLSLANTELARAARLKDEFLASMSHELRTPLNSILGRSEALQEEIYGSLSPKQIEVLRGIEESGRHLLALINDILDLSKIEADKLDLEFAPVAVGSLCRTSLQMVAQTALKKNINLTTTIDASVESIQADVRRLKQILVNLLSNAVKFTPDGGQVGIDVQGDRAGQTATFTVWDTGIGIAETDFPRLFKPFIQLDSRLSRQYEGTGLGLALVLRLAEAHGGSVTLDSTPGQGSRFSVTLPWGPMQPGSAPAADSTPPASAPPAFHQALIIEDSSTAAEQLVRYLTELGIRVDVHIQAAGAVERAIVLRPDVIVLDILLPDQSGWEVLRQLKAEPRTQAIPVVIVSVVDEPEHGRSLGAAAFLVKPINRAMLAEALQRLPQAEGDMQGQAAPVIAPGASRPHILLAEDNQSNIDVLQDFLQVNGYDVVVARTGVEAVARAQEAPLAAILMDIQMPEMDGIEAIQRIRADPVMRSIPIIALTALAMPGDRERCLTAGADEYMTKPVHLRALLAMLGRRLRRPAQEPNDHPRHPDPDY